MSTEQNAQKLSQLLHISGLFETVSGSFEEEDLNVTLFGRVQKQNRPRWDRFIFLTLLASEQQEEKTWHAEFSQKYVLKAVERDGQQEPTLAYGWNFSVSAADWDTTLVQLSEILKEAALVLPRQPAKPPTVETVTLGAPHIPDHPPPGRELPMRKTTISTLPSGEQIIIETDPLPGATKERNIPGENGKGAYLIGSRNPKANFRPGRR